MNWICEKGGHCVDPCEGCEHYIEVEPVVHSQWVESPLRNHWFAKDTCANCGFHEKDYRDMYGYKRCPNCGAKMDLEE